MKKFITVLFLFLTIQSIAQLNRSVYIDFGIDNTRYYYFQTENLVIMDKFKYENTSLFSNIGLDFSYQLNNFNFKVFTENKVYFNPVKLYSFKPHILDFDIGFEINYNNISFIYKHRCTHSIDVLKVKGGYDIFFIRYKIK